MMMNNYTPATLKLQMGRQGDVEPEASADIGPGEELITTYVQDDLRMTVHFITPYMTREERVKVAERMVTRGGRFETLLGQALLEADPDNASRILAVFPEIIARFRNL